MTPYQETVRIPHCVAKQIPVTYTCVTPRTVCCRVPINVCGETVDETTVPTVTAPQAAPTESHRSSSDMKPALPAAGDEQQPHRAQKPAVKAEQDSPKTEPAPAKQPQAPMAPVPPATSKPESTPAKGTPIQNGPELPGSRST
jgi:hypothetical protein